MDGNALRTLLERHDVTFLQATPVTWLLLFEAGWRGKPNLQAVCTGETLPPELAAKLAPAVARLWNLYGPTETTIWSTGYQVADGREPIMIGRPVANTRCYILDQRQQPVPIGVPGELYLGGDGLARGYLNQPEMTEERFVNDPFRESAARMYRTGDLARYRADGNIECLGRLDRQVKIHGYRIELGEIELALKELPEVEQAVVLARDGSLGGKRLIAFLVLKTAATLEASNVRRRLRQSLPDYMVPSAFQFLERLPISPNGKIDNEGLLALEFSKPQLPSANTFDAPHNPIEEVLARIWADVLESMMTSSNWEATRSLRLDLSSGFAKRFLNANPRLQSCCRRLPWSCSLARLQAAGLIGRSSSRCGKGTSVHRSSAFMAREGTCSA